MLDAKAMLLGAFLATVIALPVGLLGQLLVDDDDNGLVVFVFLVPILVAFVAGGFVAARQASTWPLTNGALAAVAAFALIQGVGVVRRLAASEAVALASLAFAAFLACSCGLIGALVALRVGPSRQDDDR